MKNIYAHHHEQLKQRGLNTEQIRDVAAVVGEVLETVARPKLETFSDDEVRKLAILSCNSLAGLFLLTQEHGAESGEKVIVPDSEATKALVANLQDVSLKIAKVQNPKKINEHTVDFVGQSVETTIRKCMIRGAVLPKDGADTKLSAESYLDQAIAANLLIGLIADANPSILSPRKFDTLYQENVELIDEFSE